MPAGLNPYEWLANYRRLTDEAARERAWTVFVPELWKWLVKLARSMQYHGLASHCGDIAEDAAADVLIKFHERMATLTADKDLTGWFITSLRNKLIDYGRRVRTRHEVPTDLTEEYLPLELVAVHETYGYIENELLRKILAALSPFEQDLLIGMYLLGTPGPELAAQLGIPEGTLKSRLSRLRARLRYELQATEAHN